MDVRVSLLLTSIRMCSEVRMRIIGAEREREKKKREREKKKRERESERPTQGQQPTK